ncbi:MAG TPA: hypothetical protein VG186_00830 [Solirubrobacteraceae bacterium]|nr:hypothetical protein [Solirubrobacteraceae bacterium]
MTRPSRPLLGLLVATVAFFALWLVALKPSSSNPSGNSGLGQYQSALNAAKASAAAQNRAAAAAGNTVAGSASRHASTTPAAGAKPAAASAKPAAASTTPATAKPATKSHHTTRTHTTVRPHARAHTKAAPRVTTPAQRANVVNRALAHHKVLALLFYNPAAADDQAVKRELGAIPARHGNVVKLAIPLSELASYPVVTNQVLIETSPTLVIIDRGAQAFSLVGFVDGLEIAQRVDDALSMR